ncbi:MAG TPA: class I SAM-dependent methyltransferase [Luteimonas sp.]|nr:class I SAM-dependent methyltransferase [Luteimonas sp.]
MPDERSSQSEWGARAAIHGDSLRAVLLKGLPGSVNLHIDRWHRAVLRAAFNGAQRSRKPTLDLGCGYGRLAQEMVTLDQPLVVGADYAPEFCRLFQARYGDAVCCDLSSLPFADESFSHAYAVTALMYLDFARAQEALRSLDRCVDRGARVLLLEPGAEFNQSVRLVLRRKRGEPLARPGFTIRQFNREMAPPNWKRLASGSNLWTTLMLPILIPLARVGRASAFLEGICSRLDQPRMGSQEEWLSRYALHRWVLFEVQ